MSDAVALLQQQNAALWLDMARMKRRVAVLEATSALRDAGRKPAMPVEFRSQFGEDTLAWELLGGQLEGFFIEVGAFDGYNASVTYAFESIGWKGLLVEAIPERYRQCAARRTNSRVVHAALSGRGARGTTTFTVTEDAYGGMLSYLDKNTVHAQNVAASSRTEVTVPLTTMNDLLADHPGEVDLAVIDVEGGELLVLDGFDLGRYRPKLLLIEDNLGGGDPLLTQHMQSQPYRMLGWLEVNRVYAREDLAETMQSRLR
jgi:FkbM family methyltransferase